MSLRSTCLSTALLASIASVCFAQGLSDLDFKKDFRAMRSSSVDPNGKNGDSRPLAPGETLKIMDVQGPGHITHIWFTIAAQSRDHLRELAALAEAAIHINSPMVNFLPYVGELEAA